MGDMHYYRDYLLDGWYHTMVVNWTGGKPDKEGYWVMAYKYEDSDKYTPFMVNVVWGHDRPKELIVYSSVFSQMEITVNELFSDHKPKILGRRDYILKCSTTHIQIDNVNWDYKYE